MDRITTAISEARKERPKEPVHASELNIAQPQTAEIPRGAATATQGSVVNLALPVRLFLLSVVIPIQFQMGPLVMSGTRFLLLLMFVPALLRTLSHRTVSAFFVETMFILHVLWAFLALAVNNPERLVENAGSTAVDFLGAYLLGQSYIRTSENFSALCRFLIFCVTATIPFALVESFTGRALLMEFVSKIPFISSYFFVGDMRLGLHRAQVAFPHSILYGVFCSMAFTICIISLRTSVGNGFRVIFGSIIAICTFLSLSSGALLAFLAQNALLTWASLFRNIRNKWTIFTILLICVYITIDLLSNRTPIQVFMSYATFSPGTAYIRSIIFDYGLQNVLAQPWFGLGLNDWTRPPWLHSASVDNFWLLMAMRYGIPGFLFLFIGYSFGLIKVSRGGRTDDGTIGDQRLAWVITNISVTLSLTTVHVWGSVYSLVFFFFGSGMWLLAQAKSPINRSKAIERTVRA